MVEFPISWNVRASNFVDGKWNRFMSVPDFGFRR